jgi:hypothetical protein
MSLDDDAPAAPVSTNVQLPATTIAPRANYRARPTTKVPAVPAQASNKRKHSTKSRPMTYFGDAEDEEEDEEEEDKDGGNCSGDGSSSGESASSDAPARAKRQRTSRIVTRSSIRTPALSSTSPAPAIPGQLPSVVSNANTSDPINDSSTNDVAMSIQTPDLQPASISGDSVCSLSEGISRASIGTPTDTIETSPAETEATCDELNTPSAAAEPAVPPSPVLSYDINADSVPAFLLHHGKGRRAVNIFSYLSEVKDPRFREILFHYIRFELNDKSGVNGSLPTSKRPTEVSQWTSRARPANLPDYTKGQRTFVDFADSIFVWWALIQPSWRSFKRGEVSRKIQGGWDALHAPRINGLLNVVMLAYWWAKTLEEGELEDGFRADYEQFADDVAWVFCNLYT